MLSGAAAFSYGVVLTRSAASFLRPPTTTTSYISVARKTSLRSLITSRLAISSQSLFTTLLGSNRRHLHNSARIMSSPQDRYSLTSTEEDSHKNPHKMPTLQAIHDALLRVPNMEEACQNPLAHADIQLALQLMNDVTIEDLGIQEEYLHKLNYGQCMLVSTQHESFQIAAFLLPRGFALQLHDHPEMTVCSRMLLGAARIRSFSGEVRNDSGDILNATLFVDMNKSSTDEAWLLTPSQGNFHEIFPTTDCVMLDILLPPYDDRIRPCKFYKAVRNGSGSTSGNATPPPPDCTISTNDWTLKLLPAHLQQRVRLPLNVAYNGYQPVLMGHHDVDHSAVR